MFIVSLFLCGFSSAIANRTLDPLTAEISRDLGVPVASVALLSSILALTYAAGQPIIGPSGDHLGKSRVLKVAMWICFLSTLATALAPGFPALLAARGFTGFAAGGLVPIAMAMIGDHYPPQQRQVAIARFIMAPIIGQMAGALFAGSIEALVGWRGVMHICAAFIFIAALVATFTLPTLKPASSGPHAVAAAKHNYVRIFSLPRSWVCFSSSFAFGALAFGVLPFIAPLLELQENGGAREAGMIIAGFGGGAFLLALLLPLVLRLASRPIVMIAGSLVSALSLLAYSQGPHWGLQLALLTAFGFGFFMQHNSIQAEVSELAPEARATAFAMHSFFFFLGHSIGPLVYGLQIAAVGPGKTLIINALLIGLAGSAIAFYFKSYPMRRRQEMR